MGGKRRRSRKHLYLCLAGLIALAGCMHERPAVPGRHPVLHAQTSWPRGRWDHLVPVRTRIENGDFDAAIREYQAMLSGPGGRRQADLLLYDLGLLYAHYANPRKDYLRSLASFTRLLRECPRSPLLEQARIWVDLLETMELTKRVDIELEEKMKAVNR